MGALVSESRLITTDRDADLARQVLRSMERGGALVSRAGEGGSEDPLPGELMTILRRVLEAVAGHGSVTVSAMPEELTTVAAAALIGVSRPTLLEMVKQGRLPAHKVGSHTRLRSTDVLAFLRQERERQQAAFERLQGLLDQ